MPEYVVLYQTEPANYEGQRCSWVELGHVQAPDRKRAIEQLADQEGTYAATTPGQLQTLEVRQAVSYTATPNGTGPE